MAVQFLKPMLDPGSSRVFNFNVITRAIKAKDPNAKFFFRNPPLNNIVLIKDTVPPSERRTAVSKPIGTKLYFPFNDTDVYEGGRTIFLHDKNLQQAITETVGMKASLTKEDMAEDVRILEILDGLPSLDPFLLKDIFIRSNIAVNEAYFEITPELWKEIETFVLQSFEPLVKAAFPGNTAQFDEKARTLVEKIWEARDVEALTPLIQAFRLPPERALEIFASWKGVNYYSFQHKRGLALLTDLSKWMQTIEIPVGAVDNVERKAIKEKIEQSKTQLQIEWQKVEKILNDYNDGYDKMFRHKISSAPFMEFLRNCNKSYWDLGTGLGKISHATYCWDTMTSRHPARKAPWTELLQIIKLLSEILQPEKKAASAVSW